ncbi:MAG: Gfo/Idh/MocA family oxidoreductase [Methanomicrobiales archaeon]|nr:Gfo/Idh/MocA family oxidoreductase [Methanomicrobiales archaeon]
MDVGVIGVGTMGRNHVRVYSEMKRVDALFVFDVNAKAAGETAQQCEAKPVASVEELLKKVDAASICVPTPYHHEIARKAIDHNVNILIEKPICSSAKEGQALVKIIPEELTVGVGHIERFNPIVGEIGRIVKKPLYAEMKRHNPASARITGTSVVEDLMIHDIDIVQHKLFSAPGIVGCVGNNDVCGALLKVDTTPIYLSASRKSSKKIRMIYLEEEEFTIEGDFMTQEIFIHRKPEQYSLKNGKYVQENIIEKLMVNKLEPLKLELTTFIDCVRNHTQFPVTPQQAVNNLILGEEITRTFQESAPCTEGPVAR